MLYNVVYTIAFIVHGKHDTITLDINMTEINLLYTAHTVNTITEFCKAVFRKNDFTQFFKYRFKQRNDSCLKDVRNNKILLKT